MNKKTLTFCANILARMDKEVSKRNEIYQHGVDLSNYNDDYFHCLMDSLVFILDDESYREDIEWYLFDHSNKDDPRSYIIDGKEVSVEDPVDFLTVNSLLKNKSN